MLLSLALSSCTTTQKIPSSVKESIAKICLDGEGRGRFTIKRNKYIFSFESALNKESNSKNGKWTLGVHIPMHGEELLYFSWIKGRAQVSGRFYNKLRDGLQGDSEKMKLLTSIMESWSEFLMSTQANEHKGLEFQRRSEGLLIRKEIEKNAEGQKIVWDYSGGEDYYSRLKLFLEKEGKAQKDIRIDLFYKECTDQAL